MTEFPISDLRKKAKKAAEKLWVHLYGEESEHGDLWAWLDIIQAEFDQFD